MNDADGSNLPPLLPPLPPSSPAESTTASVHAYHLGQSQFHHHHNQITHHSQIPQISQLLYREGDAWTSFLSLHQGVLNAVKNVNLNINSSDPLSADVAERELQYCAALSHAAAQCDVLHSEILKLRNLRKSRQSFDVEVLQPLLRSHTSETLATGVSLASQASMSLQTISAEVRNVIQDTRKMEAELASLHDILSSFPSHSLPTDIKISMDNKSIPLSNFVSILRKHSSSSSPSSSSPPPPAEAPPAAPSPSKLDMASVVRELAGKEAEAEALPATSVLKAAPINVRRSGDREGR